MATNTYHSGGEVLSGYTGSKSPLAQRLDVVEEVVSLLKVAVILTHCNKLLIETMRVLQVKSKKFHLIRGLKKDLQAIKFGFPYLQVCNTQ